MTEVQACQSTTQVDRPLRVIRPRRQHDLLDPSPQHFQSFPLRHLLISWPTRL